VGAGRVEGCGLDVEGAGCAAAFFRQGVRVGDG